LTGGDYRLFYTVTIHPEDFKTGLASLVISRDGTIIFDSEAGGLEPLLQFFKENAIDSFEAVEKSGFTGLTVYDKYIGRASALLLTVLKPVFVYTPVISQFGREELEKAGIFYRADKEVKFLMGVASDALCNWEKLTIGMEAEDFIAELKVRGLL